MDPKKGVPDWINGQSQQAKAGVQDPTEPCSSLAS